MMQGAVAKVMMRPGKPSVTVIAYRAFMLSRKRKR